MSMFLTPLTLSGCVHQKFVTEPYPRWEASSVSQLVAMTTAILRTLVPSDP